MEYGIELANVSSIVDQKEKTQAYKDLVSKYLSLKSVDGLKAIVAHVLQEDVPLVVSRSTLTYLATCITSLESSACQWTQPIIEYCLNQVKLRGISFEESDTMLREYLALWLMDEEEYIDAAKLYAAINMESGSKTYTDEQKAERYVKIAELYLQVDQTVEADTFINRASRFIHSATDWALKLRYKVSYARILDAKRKFLDAAMRYYDLSQSDPEQIDQSDLTELLCKSVTCALLASAGPPRSRLLGTLYKDERVKTIEYAGVLEKMHMEQLLTRPEVDAFEASLLPHQKAILANGFTVLEHAVLEHNMLAVARVYNNIKLSELGVLLGIDPAIAEKVAARMITEERLKGSIDQISKMVEFEMGDEELLSWDRRINSICFEVNNCAESIALQYPDLIK